MKWNKTQKGKRVMTDREDFMYDTLPREIIESLSRSFNARDIESVGKDLFGPNYHTKREDLIFSDITISANIAAVSLVNTSKEAKRMEELICYLTHLEGNYLNSRIVRIFQLENLLNRISENGFIYEFKENYFKRISDDISNRPDWGALKHGKSYELTVLSIDICENSLLVKEYGTSIMETIYGKLLKHVRRILKRYDGRIWEWSGDGGLLAFRGDTQCPDALSFALEFQLFLPVFNLKVRENIQHNLCLRIAMDHGNIKFLQNTGGIVSPTINYACHLQEEATQKNGISISDSVMKRLTEEQSKLFLHKETFETRTCYGFKLHYNKIFANNFLNEKALTK